MKTARKLILLFVSIWLIGYSTYNLFFRPVQKVEIIRTVQYDTIIDTVILKKPIPIFRDTGTYRIVRLPADTAAIIAALNQLSEVRVYRRTLADDSLLTATITDTVQYNALQGAGFVYSVRSKVITNTIERVTVAPPRFSLSVGGGVGYVEGVKYFPSVAVGFGKSVVSLSGSEKCLFVTYHYQLYSR